MFTLPTIEVITINEQVVVNSSDTTINSHSVKTVKFQHINLPVNLRCFFMMRREIQNLNTVNIKTDPFLIYGIKLYPNNVDRKTIEWWFYTENEREQNFYDLCNKIHPAEENLFLAK